MNPRTIRNASSKASHGLRSRNWVPALRPDVPARDPQRGRPARSAGQSARRQDRVEEGQAQRRQDRGRAQVALDPLEDGAKTDELPRRVQVEQFVRQPLGPLDLGESGEQQGAHRVGPDIGPDPPLVVRVKRRLALLAAAALVATDRAAIVAKDRASARRRRPASSSTDQVNSSATSIRPQVGQRVANRSPIETFRLDSRRGEAASPWNAASRCRTSGGRSTTSASIRVSGLDSSETVRRCRSTAARATQPPRPKRSTTTSPGPVWSSIRAATSEGDGAGAIRSKMGSE